jgi:hypothetical protein
MKDKEATTSSSSPDPEMLEEYDFGAGVRGKYAAQYAAGTNLVLLDPDIADAFPTAEAVNEALREVLRGRTATARS